MIFMHFQPSGRKLLRNPCLLHSMQWHAPVRFCCNSEQTWKKHIFMEGLCHWKSHETSQSRCSIRGAKFGTTGRQAHPNHLRIRNINPLTATYQCRFYIFMEWFDQAAIGMLPGDVSEDLVCNPPRLSFFVLGVFFWGKHHLLAIPDDFFQENRKKLWIPEIALQNTLKTGRRWSNLESFPQKFQQEHQRKHTHFWDFWCFHLLAFGSAGEPPFFGGANGKGVEIHYPPEIIFSEKGHVAAKVLYQAGHWLVKFCVLLTPEIPHWYQEESTFSKVSAYPFVGFWGCRSANVRKYLSK